MLNPTESIISTAVSTKIIEILKPKIPIPRYMTHGSTGRVNILVGPHKPIATASSTSPICVTCLAEMTLATKPEMGAARACASPYTPKAHPAYSIDQPIDTNLGDNIGSRNRQAVIENTLMRIAITDLRSVRMSM